MSGINKRVRAQVLQPQRCAMCGRTPLEDHVKLVVDHMLPKDWGGSDDPENLQPLCEDCNLGKKNHFETLSDFTEQIKRAANYAEPQKRIGELFLAFDRGEWIASDLFEAVANAKEPQEDWQRRMRDLRFLGWNYKYKTGREGRRVRSYYQLTKSAPWPDNIASAITAEARRRKGCRAGPETADR
jgi:hypothetical protein